MYLHTEENEISLYKTSICIMFMGLKETFDYEKYMKKFLKMFRKDNQEILKSTYNEKRFQIFIDVALEKLERDLEEDQTLTEKGRNVDSIEMTEENKNDFYHLLRLTNYLYDKIEDENFLNEFCNTIIESVEEEVKRNEVKEKFYLDVCRGSVVMRETFIRNNAMFKKYKKFEVFEIKNENSPGRILIRCE